MLQEKEAMPADGVTSEEIQAQVEAEVAYHAADAGIVAGLPLIKNPTLVITSSNDLTHPPLNQASSLHMPKNTWRQPRRQSSVMLIHTRPCMRPAD